MVTSRARRQPDPAGSDAQNFLDKFTAALVEFAAGTITLISMY